MKIETGVAAVYADGGLIERNPSPVAGMWAWCHVGADGWRIREGSGVIVPADVVEVSPEGVTNHHSEVLALLLGLEELPDGWSGTVYSDSKNALNVFFASARVNKLPASWRPRVGAVLRRLGAMRSVRLDGHPTKAQLKAGVGKRGAPVSEHNVHVDRLCTRAGERFMLASVAVKL